MISRDTSRPVMTDEEILQDYPRLRMEYALLHTDYRRLRLRLQSLMLSMSAHPDCTPGSEFDDLTSLAQELIDET